MKRPNLMAEAFAEIDEIRFLRWSHLMWITFQEVGITCLRKASFYRGPHFTKKLNHFQTQIPVQLLPVKLEVLQVCKTRW